MLPAEVGRAYDAFRLIDANRPSRNDRDTTAYRTWKIAYYRARDLLLEALHSAGCVPDQTYQSCLALAGLGHLTRDDVRIYIETWKYPAHAHLFCGGRSKPTGPRHAHYEFVLSGDRATKLAFQRTT